jgi:hypothetical protein
MPTRHGRLHNEASMGWQFSVARKYPNRPSGAAKERQQRAEFDAKRYFVIGCDSGKRYRIHYGASTNVHEIGDDGLPLVGWCFLPERPLIAGAAVALADGGRLVVSGAPADHGEREVPGVANIDDR